jgi:hypothetical protein
MSESLLTRTRPDIWLGGLALATSLTGVAYVPKIALADGTIYACGGYAPESEPMSDKELDGSIEREWERLKRERAEIPGGETPTKRNYLRHRAKQTKDVLRDLLEQRDRRRRQKEQEKTAGTVSVPVGAMEWLLHEVGHFVAASPEERSLPNYGLSESEDGHDGEREWQAWAFEEIVMAPFGPSRLFAPPSQRDGAAYARSGPMPEACLRHVERQIIGLGLDVERWRVEWGEWVRWGTAMGAAAPWRSVN